MGRVIVVGSVSKDKKRIRVAGCDLSAMSIPMSPDASYR